jgi:hypothetical protein
MQRRSILLMSTLLASCSAAVEPDPMLESVDAGVANGEAPTWFADIEPIVRRDCHLCHGATPLYGAPMSLVEYTDAFARHPLIVSRIKGELGKPMMPPSNIAILTPAEIDLFVRWSAAGAPKGVRPIQQPDSGTIEDAGLPISEPDAGSTEPNPEEPYGEVRVLAHMAAIRNGTTDQYGCFRTIVELPRDAHAVEITPVIEQPAVVHHLLLFRDNGRNYPREKTGLLCAADTVLSQDWELLHGWAPGGGPLVLPTEAGVRLRDGDYLVVQIHYNNPNGPTVVDSSGMVFKTTERLRANDAAVVGIGMHNFSLPPGEAAVSRSGNCTLRQTMNVFGYNPHMHLLGRGAKLELTRDGDTTLIADVQNFAFESQVHYPLNEVFQSGDILRVTCTWDTTSRTTTTRFGEGTTDEMCYMFVPHYPPIGFYACTE